MRSALFFSLYPVNQNAILFDFSIPLSVPNFSPFSFLPSCATFLSIPAVHIRNDERKFTIIYSHGNAEDVGLSLPYLDHLSQCCDCNVLAYEYCGYSIAEGEPSEKNCYECIDAAYRYLAEGRQSFHGDENRTSRQKQHRPSGMRSPVVDPSRIILFGRSLGTGPTVDLAARLLSENDYSLAAVILQSPLVSEIVSRFECMNIT